MNYKKQSKISEELLNRIISVAYGSASFFERKQIEKLALKDEEVKLLLDEYKITANRVHSISKEEYSGELKVKTISKINKSGLDDLYLILIGKPVIAAVATVLLISAITFSFFNNRELSYEGYTIAEVQKANIETKHALLIVNNIFSKTEKHLTNNILINEVSRPIKEGINRVNKLFKKEIKNETTEKKS